MVFETRVGATDECEKVVVSMGRAHYLGDPGTKSRVSNRARPGTRPSRFAGLGLLLHVHPEVKRWAILCEPRGDRPSPAGAELQFAQGEAEGGTLGRLRFLRFEPAFSRRHKTRAAAPRLGFYWGALTQGSRPGLTSVSPLRGWF